MKAAAFLKKNFLFVIAAILILAGVTVLAFWNMPKTFLKSVDVADVAYIAVFNGSTGHGFRVESSADIAEIVTNLQGIEARKEKSAANIDGFLFRLSFYGRDGECIDTLIVNRQGISDDFFVYTIEKGTPCTDKLLTLEKDLMQ